MQETDSIYGGQIRLHLKSSHGQVTGGGGPPAWNDIENGKLEKNVYKNLVGNPEEKRPRGRLRRRLVDNIRMDLRETDGKVWSGCI